MTERLPGSVVRRFALAALGLVISIGLLIIVLRSVDIRAAARIAGDADSLPLAIGILLVNVGLLPMAWRWRVLSASVGTDRPAARRYLGALLAAQAANSVLPARPGDVLRVVWLKREARGGAAAAAASMLADRSLDVLMLGVVVGVGFFFVPHRPWVIAVGVAALIGCVVLGGLWGICRRTVDRRACSSRESSGQLRRFVVAFGTVLAGRRAVMAIAHTVAIWGTWALGAWSIAKSLDLGLGLSEVAFVGGVLNVGLAIPSSPGFVGTYQWLVVSAAALFGVSETPAFAFAIVLQAAWLIPQAIIGVLVLPGLGLSLTEIRRDPEAEKNDVVPSSAQGS